ncbi:hypothetical protein C8E95_4632 [Pseudonocardia autotrophica]|uniref:Uncharacterized protein n=1 Tax=Pseudonocardia autotrophica TaxID=2074 RepID=A0A1Y2MJY2_PSEAH|nr:hypothetical protein BG845_06132 [Pseudonocardia autotrophica]TDN75463.1 hypothetical protein C8E95_4632 [Pseudonocardia autotrophica]
MRPSSPLPASTPHTRPTPSPVGPAHHPSHSDSHTSAVGGALHDSGVPLGTGSLAGVALREGHTADATAATPGTRRTHPRPAPGRWARTATLVPQRQARHATARSALTTTRDTNHHPPHPAARSALSSTLHTKQRCARTGIHRPRAGTDRVCSTCAPELSQLPRRHRSACPLGYIAIVSPTSAGPAPSTNRASPPRLEPRTCRRSHQCCPRGRPGLWCTSRNIRPRRDPRGRAHIWCAPAPTRACTGAAPGQQPRAGPNSGM